MRLGLISDVHGNSVALRASLNVLAEVGIARLYFLGDVVGYLPGDGACLELLHEAEAHCQQGNHEAMLLDVGTKPGSDSIYRLECARRRLGAASLEALGRWPLARTVEVDGRRLLLVHGTPDDPVHGRLYPDGVLEEAVRPGFDAVFMGQTHRPFVATFGDALVANVGSVGLPRDIGGLASIALYDTEAHRCSILRVPFDVDEVLGRWRDQIHESTVACLQRDAPAYVGDRVA